MWSGPCLHSFTLTVGTYQALPTGRPDLSNKVTIWKLVQSSFFIFFPSRFSSDQIVRPILYFYPFNLFSVTPQCSSTRWEAFVYVSRFFVMCVNCCNILFTKSRKIQINVTGLCEKILRWDLIRYKQLPHESARGQKSLAHRQKMGALSLFLCAWRIVTLTPFFLPYIPSLVWGASTSLRVFLQSIVFKRAPRQKWKSLRNSVRPLVIPHTSPNKTTWPLKFRHPISPFSSTFGHS